MKGYVVFLFLMMNFLGFSQCEDSDKLSVGRCHSGKANYIPFDYNIGDTIQYCCDINKIKKYSDFILSKSRKYIINRAGDKFFRKLELGNELNVNYNDSLKISYEDQSLYRLSEIEHTYSVFYIYKNKNIVYAFELEFDKEGNMISENQFPKFIEGQDFEKFTPLCDALAVVKNDERFAGKKVKNIELAYLDEVNSFCWLIIEQDPAPKELGKWEQYSLDLYYINAVTNELVTIKKEAKARISCGYKPQK